MAMRLFGKKKKPQRANYIGRLAGEGISIVKRLIKTYGIKCDLKSKNIFVAFNSKQMKKLKREHQLMQQYAIKSKLLDKEELKKHLNSDIYCGGLLDLSAGHLHPLNLVLGEAAAFEKLGGTIYENSPAISIKNTNDTPIVKTDKGEVRCRRLLLCGNGYLDIVPKLNSRILSASTQMVATEPLGKELAKQLIPSDACVSDQRYILDYYRISEDYRLLFGGGVLYGGKTPKDIESKLRPNIEKIFPQLKGIKIDYTWSGNMGISFSRFPQMGSIGKNIYFAHGYSGHGVASSHLFGQILSEVVTGDATRYFFFKNLPWLPFPGGRKLRVPYSVLGSWWCSFRDFLRI